MSIKVTALPQVWAPVHMHREGYFDLSSLGLRLSVP
jgi:hypothetical protein